MRKGDVVALRLPKGLGHEQAGRRFGVVVQSDAFLERSTVIVAPTSTSARPTVFRPTIAVNGVVTTVLVEQLHAVDVRRLGRRARHLDLEERFDIDRALEVLLGLER